MNELKATVSIISDTEYCESYNSAFRAVVSKPVNEKYARKLIQTYLKSVGIYGATINKLYESYNGINSQQDDRWVFGLSIPPVLCYTGALEGLLKNATRT